MTEKQLRFLFASHILSHEKGGGVHYNKGRGAALRKLAGKGAPSATYQRKVGRAANVSHNHNTNAVKAGAFSGRAVIGGKAAHLRGGASRSSGTPARQFNESELTKAARLGSAKEARRYRSKAVELDGQLKALKAKPLGQFDTQAGRDSQIHSLTRQIKQYRSDARNAVREGNKKSPRVPSVDAQRPHDATRAQRIEKARHVLLTWATKQAIGYRNSKAPELNKKGVLKEMEAKFGGTYLDTGKPFARGDKLFYGTGRRGVGAYSRQQDARHLGLGQVPITNPKKGQTAVQVAAARVIRDAISGDSGQRTSYRTVKGFRKRFQTELSTIKNGGGKRAGIRSMIRNYGAQGASDIIKGRSGRRIKETPSRY